MTTRSITRPVAAAAALALPLSAGAAVSIDVQISQVAGSIWRYEYILSGDSFQAPPTAPGPHGFSLYFDYTRYSGLANESTTNASWDLFVEQPDGSFFLDGLFDALAASSPAGTGAPFSIDFEWLGAGTPTGVQAFDYYTCADVACAGFSDVQSGTTAPVATTPLPGSLALIAAGLLGLGLRQARRTKNQ